VAQAYAKKKRLARKERLTVSVSRETREYLETACERAHAPSMSAFLESLVQDLRAKTEMAAIEAQTAAYYDSLSEAQMEEQADWGTVGAASVSQLES
jgi:hypothetical protein